MTEPHGEYNFLAHVNPVPWKAPTLGTRRFGGKVAPTTSPNAEMHTYQEALREQFSAQWGDEPIDGLVEFHWTFARRIGSYINASGRRVVKQRCDLSNLVKSSEDAIQPRKGTTKFQGDPWGIITNDRNVWRFSAAWDRQDAEVEPYVALRVVVL